MATIQKILTPKENGVWGKPNELVIDCAWEHRSPSLIEALKSAGISAHWAPEKTPEYKGIGERPFDTINKLVFHRMLGGSVEFPVTEMRRLGLDPSKTANITIEKMEELLDYAIDSVYANRVHKGIADPKGTIPQILHLAVRALSLAKIEMLVIDEMQHLIQSETQKTMWSVADAIKWLSIKGVCAISCVGIRSIMNVISATSNRSQFAIRCREPILLNPVDMSVPEQRLTFIGYLLALDERLVSHGIFEEKSNLAQQDWIDCFYDVSHGILGRASRLVEAAASVAIRQGRVTITREDLSYATERWAMTLSLTDHDPWREGARDYGEIAKLAQKDL